MAKQTKYQWTAHMTEIGGRGGDAERDCRQLFAVGMEWLDEHPGEFERLWGDDFRGGAVLSWMANWMRTMDAVTGRETDYPMMVVTLIHIMRARVLGWDAYEAAMQRGWHKDQIMFGERV